MVVDTSVPEDDVLDKEINELELLRDNLRSDYSASFMESDGRVGGVKISIDEGVNYYEEASEDGF